MKRILVGMIGILVTIALNSCASFPKADSPKAAVKGFHAELTDWQSASVGGSVPEWVEAVLNADSEDSVRSLLKKPKGYRIWTLDNQGENLDAQARYRRMWLRMRCVFRKPRARQTRQKSLSSLQLSPKWLPRI